ncbi:MAG TPA: hypothetical protein VF701_13805 [Thermoanaerobaculia bacterium]
MTNRPDWYTNEHDSAWERTKAAFKNDWEQTKNDFGSKKARDLDQDVDDTLKQAAGADDAFENHEQAFRFGHAAGTQYRNDHPKWDNDLDARLRRDYSGDYENDRPYIQKAYEFDNRK